MMKFNDRWKPAEVIVVSQDAPRLYVIKTPEGQTYYRNSRHLKRMPDNNNTNLTLNDNYLSDDPLDSTTTILPNEMNRSDS